MSRLHFALLVALVCLLNTCRLSAADAPKAANDKPAAPQSAEKKPAAPKPPAYTDPKEADADFPLQGEYVGRVNLHGASTDVGVQVIALGEGKFHAVFYVGGLPGAGYDGKTKFESDGEKAEGRVVFRHEKGEGRLVDGTIEVFSPDGVSQGKLTKTERTSPTMGAKPPVDAVVLFDGTSADAFQNGKVSPEGWLMEGSDTVAKFYDCHLHLEFRSPYMPTARGQQRGNSGCYLQSRYETQILDSFGLAGKNNECGGLYEIKDPDVNMCLPPLAWQTYDIDFTAARYDDVGNKTSDARISVWHNGVVVQNDVPLPRTTRAAPLKEDPAPGPLHLQNHGNPVRFRNIWLIKR